MNARAYTDRYTAAQVNGIDRERLLLLMFEGGLRFLRLTRDGLAAGDLPRFAENLARAQAIVGELRGTLDHEVGGPLTRDLARLYDFMLFHLTEGNAQKSVRHVDEVIRTFGIVADAFRTVIERRAAGAQTAGDGAA
jgi:flagellar secretion chaperone FliS